MERTPTFEGRVSANIRAHLQDLRVALPGIVQRYDAVRQRADVQPAIRDGVEGEDGERLTETLPVLTEVPVVFPSGTGGALTFPLSTGDEVLLVFSSSSLDRWLARGGVVDPEYDWRHALTDAVAIPGLRHAPHATTAIGLGAVLSGSAVQLGGSTAVNPLILSTPYLTALNTLLAAIAAAMATITSGAPAGGTPAGTAITTAITAFNASVAGFLSPKVKTE